MNNGWEKKKLGELCTLISGRHIEAKDYNTKSRGIGYLTGPADFGQINPVVTKWTEHPQAIAQSGDILVTVKGAGVGKINLLDSDNIAISRQLMAVRVKDVDPRFVFIFIGSQFDYFQSLGTGATVPGLSRDDILGLQLRIPPLHEQRRIVGILDEAFDGIATAKANAEKNLQNAHALFESYLQAVFNHEHDDWYATTLDEVCELITDGKHGDCQDEEGSGYYFLSAKNIKNGTLQFDEGRQIKRDDFLETHRRTRLESGDVLITNSGTIGRMAVAPMDARTERTTFQKSVAILKPTQSMIDSRFLFHCLSAGLSRLVGLSAGAAQKNLLLRDIRSYSFFCPPRVDEQHRVALRLDHLKSESNALESIYQRKLAALDELKKSLLHQAFSGKL